MAEEDNSTASYRPQTFQTPLNTLGSTILVLTNPEDDLYKTELMFRGLKVTEDGTLAQAGKPMMNDRGVNDMIGLVHDFLSRNCNMSNIETIEEIDALRNDLAEDLREKLMVSATDYGIADNSTRSLISGTIIRQAHISLKRAYLEGDKRFLRSSHHEINQNINARPQEKSGGWMSFFK